MGFVSIMLLYLIYPFAVFVNSSLKIHEYLMHLNVSIADEFVFWIPRFDLDILFQWLIGIKTLLFVSARVCLCANNYRLFDPTELVRNGSDTIVMENAQNFAMERNE